MCSTRHTTQVMAADQTPGIYWSIEYGRMNEQSTWKCVYNIGPESYAEESHPLCQWTTWGLRGHQW